MARVNQEDLEALIADSGIGGKHADKLRKANTPQDRPRQGSTARPEFQDV